MSLTGEFQDKAIVRAAQLTRAQQTHDDLQNEIAGRETGRQSRFLNASDEYGSERRKKGERAHAALSALDLLLLDPEYAKAYEATHAALTNAEHEAEQAISAALETLYEARANLEDIRDRAAELPDGTKVFRDASGDVWTEDGTRVDDETAASIEWRGNEPSREDYLSGKAAFSAAQDHVDAWLHYQTNVLGEARERFSNPDNPPSKAELEDIMRDIEDQKPTTIRNENDIAPTVSKPVEAAAFDVNKPAV